jgi:hypothetical protein
MKRTTSSVTGTPVSFRQSQEMVNHPDHYQGGKYEVIDIIEDFGLNFSLGNAIKYILRAGHKDPQLKKEDLRKAVWYLERELKKEGG